ncbi:helix-turn-helix domain-containing protein [Streptomyces sp. NPDC054904]|uniref:helix-turn-helix domain-containing protein n=1 Tax=unclassified Streptomyces TaxID=2593676 RepID=UPI002481BDA3|nr:MULTISPECIES: helix-turn-helix domain-containing protein [unclassified Streptomyces]MDA5283623.1 helix-turn-helix domain-containing protein [Streptomyces sp. Isolate_45]MDX2391871.1 helix-turn-helix domain-containing protein [Streptomyces sp. DK15]
MAVLELLAADAPQSRYDALLEDARCADAGEEQLARLARAVELARSVRADAHRSKQREAALTALVDTAHDLTSPYDIDGLLRLITRRARRLLGFDMAWLSLSRPDGSAYVRTSEGETTALNVGLELGTGKGLGSIAQERRSPVWTADYLADPAIAHAPGIDAVVEAEGLRAIIAVPLRRGSSTLGALYGSDRAVRQFTPDEIGMLLSLADLAAVAIEKARLLEQTRDEVTELEAFGSRTNTALTRVRHLWECHARLAGLVLDGAGLATLARATADALDGVLQVRDPGGRPLTATGELPHLDEESVTKGALQAQMDRRPVRLPGELWLAPVLAGAEDLGVLLLSASAPLAEEDVRLLQLAAQSVASLMLIQRGTAAAEGPVHDELLADLLERPHSVDLHLLERTRRLGIDLDRPHVVVVARPEGGELGKAVAWASSYAYRMGGLKGVRRGCIVLVLPGGDASAAAHRASGELSPLLGHAVSTGAAGPAGGPGEVARVYAEAVRCLDALTALDGAGGTASLRELGFLGLLLSADHDVESFIASTIGPVLEYDSDRMTGLTRTLDAYFASGGSPTHAAEALHVHPNTVSRRLERIAELLGTDWQKPGRALEIQMALRLRKARTVLHDRRTAGARPR